MDLTADPSIAALSNVEIALSCAVLLLVGIRIWAGDPSKLDRERTLSVDGMLVLILIFLVLELQT